jgi:hypothetical protein
MCGQPAGIGTAKGAGTGAAMAVEELKFCAFGAPNNTAKTKATFTIVKVITVLFIFPPRF